MKYEDQKRENLKKVLSSGKLHISGLSELAGFKKSATIHDFKRGRGLLTDQQVVDLKTAINTLRINCKSVLNEFDKNRISESGINLFRDLYNRNEIVWFVVFDRNRNFHNKINGWKRGMRSFPVDEIDQLKSFLLIFLAETNI